MKAGYNGSKSASKIDAVQDAVNPPHVDRESTALDEILKFSEVIPADSLMTRAAAVQKPLTASLLRLDPLRTEDALHMFELICRYMGCREAELGKSEMTETAVELMRICAKHPELKNELYMQLLKQSRHVESEDSRIRVWELWLIAATIFDPSKVMMGCCPMNALWALGVCVFDF